MPLDTLKTLAIQYSKKQPKQIDTLTEDAPILAQFPFAPSTHEMWHVAEAVESVNGAGFVAIDAPLPEVDSTTKLIRFDLGKMGGMMEVGEDKARLYGGKERYFADKTGPVLKMTGSNTERTLVYDNLRQYAIDQYLASAANKCLYTAGGAANTNYCIVVVRYEEGVCSGLYNPKGFGNGVMFDTMPINGGNLYKNDDGVLVYGVRLKTDLGCQLTGNRNVGAIVNIDLINNKAPTAAQIDDVLADIRATGSGRTVMLMHQRVKNRLLRDFKDERIQMRPADAIIDRSLDAWGDVPILTSYNFYDGTEATVALA